MLVGVLAAVRSAIVNILLTGLVVMVVAAVAGTFRVRGVSRDLAMQFVLELTR